MCLTIDKELTRQYLEKYKDQEFEVWKHVEKIADELVTPFRHKTIQPGYFKANRLNLINRFVYKYFTDGLGSGAIHTYSEDYNDIYRRTGAVIKCKVHIKDFIAAGYFHNNISLGFKKIFIPEEEYKRVFDGWDERWKNHRKHP
jgi:hypothetical protein